MKHTSGDVVGLTLATVLVILGVSLLVFASAAALLAVMH